MVQKFNVFMVKNINVFMLKNINVFMVQQRSTMSDLALQWGMFEKRNLAKCIEISESYNEIIKLLSNKTLPYVTCLKCEILFEEFTNELPKLEYNTVILFSN